MSLKKKRRPNWVCRSLYQMAISDVVSLWRVAQGQRKKEEDVALTLPGSQSLVIVVVLAYRYSFRPFLLNLWWNRSSLSNPTFFVVSITASSLSNIASLSPLSTNYQSTCFVILRRRIMHIFSFI
jgi:hypothetical protein